jgi:PAT family beta-lactamase induction signal transducer AmpG
MTADETNAVASPGWRYYLQEKVVVIFFLGFSAGLPFLLVYSTLSAWLSDAGLELRTISTFAWLGFAYSLKFAWAPFVDSLPVPVLTRLLGRRRSWLLLAQVAIVASLLAMAMLDPAQTVGAFALIALAVAFSSATQDIVIDAYRIECAEDQLQGVLEPAGETNCSRACSLDRDDLDIGLLAPQRRQDADKHARSHDRICERP